MGSAPFFNTYKLTINEKMGSAPFFNNKLTINQRIPDAKKL